MRIIDFLKDFSARVVYEDRWLVVSEESNLFSVYQRKFGQKKTRCLIETYSEEEAVRILENVGG